MIDCGVAPGVSNLLAGHAANVLEERSADQAHEVVNAIPGTLDWVNRGLWVDERGVRKAIPGTRRGSPADFEKFVESSANALVTPAK